MKRTLILTSVLAAAIAARAENPPEGSGIFGAYAASKAWTPPTDPAVLKKLQQWQDQKLGLLITWGTAWSYKPNDQFKSVGTLIRNLCRIVARNGNYLIGIGVGPDGELDPTVYERFKQLSAWLKVNGEAVYGARPIKPYERGNCVFTGRRDGAVYAVILAKDDRGTLPETVALPAELTAHAGRLALLGFGALQRGATKDGLTTIEIPAAARNKPPCAHAWTIKLAPRRAL